MNARTNEIILVVNNQELCCSRVLDMFCKDNSCRFCEVPSKYCDLRYLGYRLIYAP